MSERSFLPLVAVVCLLVSALLVAFSNWWLALLFFLLGIGAALWVWLNKRVVADPTDIPEQTNHTLSTDSTNAVKEVALADAVELPKPPNTTELLPSVEERIGLSAEEMAIQKPTTSQATTAFEGNRLDEAIRKAEATHAQKEKDETLPSRPEKPIAPAAGLSAEEIAIQKPFTPQATERLDDKTIEDALAKAKQRAEKQKAPTALTAEQMAAEKPETPSVTRKILRSMLPPTSTREMATSKPSTEVSTHEMESTVEIEAAQETPETQQMAEEKPATPLSTIEASVEPGALPIDTPLMNIPSPATQVMEVKATPNQFDPRNSTEETIEITPPEGTQIAEINDDDLQRIEGIGPKIAALLIGEGISTFSRLAATPEEELHDILKKGGLRLAPTLSTWKEQAALAARGDWNALKEFQDKIGNHDQ